MSVIPSIYHSLKRQVNHWLMAANRLAVLDNMAAPSAWHGVDQKMTSNLKNSFEKNIHEIIAVCKILDKKLSSSSDEANLRSVRRELLQVRSRYLKVEETIHFYTIAINSRTTPGLAALLRACDVLCMKSMQDILHTLGRETPMVLTYVDKGIGASILKAGLRLWDGNISSVAAIKVTQHNLYRPTAIIHETGHQVAHILNWNEELSDKLLRHLTGHPSVVAEAFAGWSSEMAADAFAFVHTGFAAVAALHDVVSGMPQAVFAYHQHDPHPISYIRVLLNIEMCRLCYGYGSWDDLETAFKNDYDINLVNYPSVKLIHLCVKALPDVAKILLAHSYNSFQNRSLTQIISPEKVSPKELDKLEYMAGPALFTSHAWIWKECLRLLALGGYKIGTGQGDLSSLYKQQEEWMTKLGFAVELN